MISGTKQIDWFDWVAGSGRRSVLVLAVIALVSFLPGFFSLPPIDRDEARFAQASRQMVATGDWIDIRLQEKPRHKQPIGIYWLQSALVSSFGEGGIAPIWLHRLPSLAGAIASVLLTYWLALAFVGRQAALLAGAMMAVSLLLGAEARLAKTDAVLLSTILLAQNILARAYLLSSKARGAGARVAVSWRPWAFPILFWTAIAAGVLVKGPIIILYVGLTIAALVVVERSASFLLALRPAVGIIWCLALAAPWFVAIGLQTDGAFYRKAIGFSVAGKILQSHEGHGAPPLTHAALFWATFWPGSLIFALAIPRIWRRRKEPWLRFLLCWAVPAWIVLELVTTKLPHYILPALPAIAIAASGIAMSGGNLPESRIWRRFMAGIMSLLAVAACGVIALAAWFASDQALAPRVIAVAVFAVLLIGATLVLALKGLESRNFRTLVAGLFGGMVALYWLLYPSAAKIALLWPARQVAEIIETSKQCDMPFLVSAGYHEPSLVFSTRTDVVLTDGASAADRLKGHDCGFALIEERELAAFGDRAQEIGLEPAAVGRASGVNIGGGRMIDVTVFAPVLRSD